MTITEQLDMAFPAVPGFKGQGWSTQETVMVVRWLFANPAAWERAMSTARAYPENPHTVADTLHEQIVPRSELDAIVTAGGDPAKVNWLEIAHELLERRDDPHPAQEHAGIATISGQLEFSAASSARAHATASATARRTASEHAKERMAELRDDHGRWDAGAAGAQVPAALGAGTDGTPPDVIGQYKDWRDSLTPAEDKAMRFYQSPGFALMNGQLRGLDPAALKSSEHASDDDLRRARKASKDLAAAIRKAPPLKQDTTVYRGFDAAQFGDLEPGKVVKDPGFVSTSVTDDAGAVGRAKSAGQMKLTLPAGTRVAAGSVRELILPPGSSVRVTGVTRKGSVTSVTAELVQPGTSLTGEPHPAAVSLAAQATADGPDDPAAAMATARHLHDTAQHLASASGHLDKAREAPPGDPDGHISETARHLDGALTSAHDLAAHLRDRYPAEGADLDALTETIGLARSVSDQAKTATTAHLTQTICNHLGHTIAHVEAMRDDPDRRCGTSMLTMPAPTSTAPSSMSAS